MYKKLFALLVIILIPSLIGYVNWQIILIAQIIIIIRITQIVPKIIITILILYKIYTFKSKKFIVFEYNKDAAWYEYLYIIEPASEVWRTLYYVIKRPKKKAIDYIKIIVLILMAINPLAFKKARNIMKAVDIYLIDEYKRKKPYIRIWLLLKKIWKLNVTPNYVPYDDLSNIKYNMKFYFKNNKLCANFPGITRVVRKTADSQTIFSQPTMTPINLTIRPLKNVEYSIVGTGGLIVPKKTITKTNIFGLLNAHHTEQSSWDHQGYVVGDRGLVTRGKDFFGRYYTIDGCPLINNALARVRPLEVLSITTHPKPNMDYVKIFKKWSLVTQYVDPTDIKVEAFKPGTTGHFAELDEIFYETFGMDLKCFCQSLAYTKNILIPNKPIIFTRSNFTYPQQEQGTSSYSEVYYDMKTERYYKYPLYNKLQFWSDDPFLTDSDFKIGDALGCTELAQLYKIHEISAEYQKEYSELTEILKEIEQIGRTKVVFMEHKNIIKTCNQFMLKYEMTLRSELFNINPSFTTEAVIKAHKNANDLVAEWLDAYE